MVIEFAVNLPLPCSTCATGCAPTKSGRVAGMIGFNNKALPSVGFRFITDGYTNIDDYIFRACMEKVIPVIEKATENKFEIRNLMLATHQIDKTNQMNLFFCDETKHTARCQALDEIKNRFGHRYITTANTLERVEGNTTVALLVFTTDVLML